MEPSESSDFTKLRVWRWLQLVAVVFVGGLVAVAVVKVGWQETIETTLTWVRAKGPLMFFLAMALLPAVGFPLLPFTLAAGPAFGPSLGIANVIFLALIAVTANVALSYGLAVRWLAPLADRRGWKLPRPSSRLTFPLMLLLRIMPGIPFWVQSYVLGLIRAPFLSYMAVSTLIPAFYITGTVLGTTAVLQGKREMAWFAFGGILLLGTALHFVRVRHAAEIAALRARE